MPVTLFVDDGLLAELLEVPDHDIAARAFAQAVRSRLGGEGSGRMFESIRLETFQWKTQGADGYPPFLPLLAACVLAATHMVAEGGIAASNYYRRFRDLLELTGSGEPRGYGDVIPVLWEQLRWWMDEDKGGRLGQSTIRAHPTLAYIGFALSQALFREADRRRLTEFYRWLGLQPREVVGEEELLAYFGVWPALNALGPGVRRMLSDALYREDLGRILATAAAAWNGVVVDEAGRRTGELVVALDLSPPPTLGLMAERPEGFPDRAAFRVDEATFSLSSTAEGWYDEVLPVDAEILEDGLTLKLTGFRLAWSPRDVIPMRTIPALGRWASVSQLLPSEAHCVLVQARATEEVEGFLEQNAAPGWRRRERPGLLPGGWNLFTDVFVEAPPMGEVDDELRSLVPSPGERPTLRGGLRLPGGLRTYLLGGEPDLWVPPRTLGDDIEVELSSPGVGQRITHRFPPEGGKAPLHLLELGAGQHTVTVGPSTVAFQTIETIGELAAADSGSVGYELAQSTGEYSPASPGAVRFDDELSSGKVRVIGALIMGDEGDLPPSARPPLIALYRDEEFTVLGASPGEIQRGRRPSIPTWPEGLSLDAIGYEVHPRFEPTWLLRRSRLGGLKAVCRDEVPPRNDPSSGASQADVRSWAREFLRDPAFPNSRDQTLWEQYAATAKELL